MHSIIEERCYTGGLADATVPALVTSNHSYFISDLRPVESPAAITA